MPRGRRSTPVSPIPSGEPLAGFTPASAPTGDVLARFQVRVEEVEASLALIADYGGRPGTARVFRQCGAPSSAVDRESSKAGAGATTHRVEVDETGRLGRVKVVDPSFFNWPALSVALADTIVPDFPLANKSFNLSYAGNDL